MLAKKKQNRIFFKDRIPHKSKFIVWVEPDPGSEHRYSVLLTLEDDDVRILDRLDITDAITNESAYEMELVKPKTYVGFVDVVFDAKDLGATIHTIIVKPGDSVFGKCPCLKVPHDGATDGSRPLFLRTIKSN